MQVPQQAYTFFVSAMPGTTEVWLPVDADSTLGSIKSEMIEAGITAAGYGNVLAKNPDGDLAQACLRRGGFVNWEMLTAAIRAAEMGTNIDALVGWIANTSEVTLDAFSEEYLGCWDSLADYVEGRVIDSGELAQVPERLRPFIDWESFGRKQVSDCVVWVHETADGVHVYRG